MRNEAIDRSGWSHVLRGGQCLSPAQQQLQLGAILTALDRRIEGA